VPDMDSAELGHFSLLEKIGAGGTLRSTRPGTIGCDAWSPSDCRSRRNSRMATAAPASIRTAAALANLKSEVRAGFPGDAQARICLNGSRSGTGFSHSATARNEDR
jgi:hypothetical protein